MPTVFDLQNLYQDYFSKKPVVLEGVPQNRYPKGTIHYSSKSIAFNKTGLFGQDVWFPVEFHKNGQKAIEIEACTIAVNLVKTIVRTPVSERKGTFKETFNVDDYKFTIRGFLIGKGRKFPETEISVLKDLFETGDPVELHGGYPEIFLDETCRVVLSSLEFPEVQGKGYWIRPFIMNCESDFIQELEIK